MSSAEVLGDPAAAVKWILLGTSLAVGVALALDGFLNLGERWRHYRRAVELLKSQGWRLVQRTIRTPASATPTLRAHSQPTSKTS